MGKKEDAEDAHKFRLKVAEELLQLFEQDTGLPAKSVEELSAWASSARGKFFIEKNAKLVNRKNHTKN